MRPEDVDAALVEKVEASLREDGAYSDDVAREWVARHALAAVLPEIQAQALEDAATTVTREVGIVWPSQRHADIGEAASYAAEVLRANAHAKREGKSAPYAIRLTITTTEGKPS